jgi:molybdopterin/thiamine biosynthesis adenylyltransferase
MESQKINQETQIQYQFPRYLGLNSSKKNKHSLDCEFGFSKKLKKSLKLDNDALALLKYCFQPRTTKEIAKKFQLTNHEVLKVVKLLEGKGILTSQIEKKIPDEFKRYDRHLLYYQTLGADCLAVQEKLSKSKVALIGMGGIGNWVSLNLIGSGLKEIKIIDFDFIELSNLTRQVLFDEKSVGLQKAKEAQKILTLKNSSTKISVVDLKIDNAESLKSHLEGFDIVVLSADKPQFIHDWVDEICVDLNIAYINMGYRDGEGVIGPLTVPGKTSCYQCFKQNKKSIKNQITQNLYLDFDGRYQAPSFGPINSMVSSIGSLEVLKYLGQFAKPLSLGVELSIDPNKTRMNKQSFPRDKKCWHCKKK